MTGTYCTYPDLVSLPLNFEFNEKKMANPISKNPDTSPNTSILSTITLKLTWVSSSPSVFFVELSDFFDKIEPLFSNCFGFSIRFWDSVSSLCRWSLLWFVSAFFRLLNENKVNLQFGPNGINVHRIYNWKRQQTRR